MNMTAPTQSGSFQVASHPAPQGSVVPQQSPSVATTSEASQPSRQETTQFHSSGAQQLSCLYTKQKTQKRKIWRDGRLVLNSTQASLYDAHPPPGSGDPKLDECEVTRSQRDALLRQIENQIETEKFLIEVNGPWTTSTTAMAMAKPNPLVSQGMQKVMTRKFRKPEAFIPRNPMQEWQNPTLSKRQRPLQPGELQQRYYGHSAKPSRTGPPPPEQSAWMQAAHNVAGNQPDGRRTVHFQRKYDEQQSSQNQVWPRYENHNLQPSFQGRQTQSAYENAANRPQVLPSASPHSANRPATNIFPPSAPPQSYVPMQETLQDPTQSEMRSIEPTAGENSFANNEFNPSNFYGEDEELSQEDDYVDANLGGWSLRSVGIRVPQDKSPKQGPIFENHDQSGATRSRMPENAAELILAKPDVPSVLPLHLCDGPSEAPSTRDETADICEALSTNELLKLFGAAPAPALAQPDNVDESNSATQISEHPTQFEFVLPPASDSSSDEDDSDNPGEP